jgi:D-alanyl-lipoteichoic acid acyltransferase DltB (MBOAT superfamily)
VARNIMLTMMLGGLWHGGAWTFVFGERCGVMLVLHRQWSEWKRARRLAAVTWIRLALTAWWICFTWIFPRPDLERAGIIAKSFCVWQAPRRAISRIRMIWIVVCSESCTG